MLLIRAMLIAISTYTRIPVPQLQRDDRAMKLSLAFLPLIGLIIGATVWGWQIICQNLELSGIMFAAIAVSIPVFITGGIHLDGFCDTADALTSYQDKERRLEILKDPHVGAFALIRLSITLIIQFALWFEIYHRGFDEGVICLYSVSRCIAAWTALILPKARQDGMLASHAEKNNPRLAVMIILTLLTVSALIGWALLTYPRGLFSLLICLPVTLWYSRMVKKCFGGVTGDTTGYYLQVTEMAMLTGLFLGGLFFTWI